MLFLEIININYCCLNGVNTLKKIRAGTFWVNYRHWPCKVIDNLAINSQRTKCTHELTCV